MCEEIEKIHERLKADCPNGVQLNLAYCCHEFGRIGAHWTVAFWDSNYQSAYGSGETPDVAMQNAIAVFNSKPKPCPTCGR